jgi:biotin carboxyl carrier protein
MTRSVVSRRVDEEVPVRPGGHEAAGARSAGATSAEPTNAEAMSAEPTNATPEPPQDVHEQLEHGHATGESVGLAVRLLVSPAAGRLRHLPPVEFHDGAEWVAAGQAVAVVEQGRGTIDVQSPIDARVAGILVRDGEPVALGQPLVWLEEAPRRTTSADPPGDRR